MKKGILKYSNIMNKVIKGETEERETEYKTKNKIVDLNLTP